MKYHLFVGSFLQDWIIDHIGKPVSLLDKYALEKESIFEQAGRIREQSRKQCSFKPSVSSPFLPLDTICLTDVVFRYQKVQPRVLPNFKSLIQWKPSPICHSSRLWGLGGLEVYGGEGVSGQLLCSSLHSLLCHQPPADSCASKVGCRRVGSVRGVAES